MKKEIQLPSLYQQFIHLSRYSRWIESEKRRETWNETVSRYFDFFENHLKESQNYNLPKQLRNELEDAILNLEIMPSMRSLMTAGEALSRDNVAGYNCSYIAVNRVRAFDEILYVLMCLSPNTEIVTLNGIKKICDIDPNIDLLLTYNESTKGYEYEQPIEILETRTGSMEPIVKLTMDDGFIVECTADHQFLTKNRGWVKAKDLEDFDELEHIERIYNTGAVPQSGQVQPIVE